MRKSTSSRTLALLISAALILALGASSLCAQETFKVAGKWTATQVKHDTTNIADADGHFFSMATFTATNISTGETEFMDGAPVFKASFGDLLRGNGPQKGYVVLTESGNTVACSFEGQVAATEGKDGPIVTFWGTFTWTAGTGQYAGIQGKGDYRGHYTSQTTMDVEWVGEYSITK